jgi:YD repeat-containing protein
MRRLFLLFLAILSLPACGWSQTGLPPFGSLDRIGLEVRNNQDLNVLLAIPVMSSPGRAGLNLNFNVVYNSSIWTNSFGAWEPNNMNALWGWTTSYSTGQTSYQVSSPHSRCGFIDGMPAYNDYTIYKNYQYIDPLGTPHSFNITWTYVYDECTQTETISGGGTASATDGSGYLISVSTSDGSIQSLLTRGGYEVGGGGITDPNGNYISASTQSGETDWTDSVGRVALKTITGSSSIQYKFYDPTGAYQTTTLYLQTFNIKTNFGCSGVVEYTGSASLPVSLVLPNGQQYSFTYESYVQNSTTYYTGRLRRVTFPTGGYHEYDYTGANDGINCADGTTLSMNRVVSDGTSTATWNYVRNTTNLTTTITTPKLADTPNTNDTVITFNSSGQEVSRKIYANSPGSGTPLRTINTTWASNGTLATRITILDDGSTQSEVATTYDSNGLLDSVSEYNFGPGAPGSLLRTTNFTYQTSTNYTNLNILDLVISKQIKDGSGTVQFRQDTTYDGVPLLSANCPTGAPQHDDYYGCTFNYRGNPTQVTTYLTPGTPANGFATSFVYDWFGNVVSATDPQNDTTSFSYTDSWVNTSCVPSSNTYAYVKSVTNALSQVTNYKYYACVGLVGSVTDPNNQTAATSYDLMRRPSSATDPLSNTTNFTYTASTSAESTLNFNSGNSTVDVLATFDTLGRTQVQQMRQAPGSANFDSVETDYDLADRPYRVTAPYSAAAGITNSSAPATTTAYDVLGRISSVTDAGNGSVTYSYSKNDVLVTIGPAPNGENNKRRQSEYDALGRLTSVCEITAGTTTWPSASCGQNTSATGYLTKYTYDTMGNLLTVTQNAQSTSNQQTRTYTFDALGRLTSQKNPEMNQVAINYTYDTDSTCGTSTGDLVKRLDAIGNITCYTYDSLHRVLSQTYSVTSPTVATPNKCFVYDTAIDGNTVTNTKGRLAEAYTTTSACSQTTLPSNTTDVALGYSGRGEVTDAYEKTPHSGGTGAPYNHSTASFWASGAINTLGGPVIPLVTYGADPEGRTSTISDGSGHGPVTNTTYNLYTNPPQQSVTFGSNDSDVFSFDANTLRLTKYQFNVGSKAVTGTLN